MRPSVYLIHSIGLRVHEYQESPVVNPDRVVHTMANLCQKGIENAVAAGRGGVEHA
jgi:hypothetical protein